MTFLPDFFADLGVLAAAAAGVWAAGVSAPSAFFFFVFFFVLFGVAGVLSTAAVFFFFAGFGLVSAPEYPGNEYSIPCLASDPRFLVSIARRFFCTLSVCSSVFGLLCLSAASLRRGIRLNFLPALGKRRGGWGVEQHQTQTHP